jgi:type II secretory pathway component PulJ
MEAGFSLLVLIVAFVLWVVMLLAQFRLMVKWGIRSRAKKWCVERSLTKEAASY